jgi:serine palmitoyltransferase
VLQDAYCTPRCIDALGELGASACAARGNGGTSPIVEELEHTVADFLGKEDALVFGMGYVTNSAVIPALCGHGDLIISDALNHNSIVTGARGSGASVQVFRHNDAGHLERVLRQAISHGQPRLRRPWRKIIIVVEGIYSMEGEVRAVCSQVFAIAGNRTAVSGA